MALVPLGAGVAVGGTSAQTPTITAQVNWIRTLERPGEPIDVSFGPGGSSIILANRDSSAPFAYSLRRLTPGGATRWSVSASGSGGAVKGLTGERIAVSRKDHAVYLAGTAVCQGDEPGAAGPSFVRGYSLSGDRRWTHWVAGCPRRASGLEPRHLHVTGIDATGGHIAFSLQHGVSCCSRTVGQGSVHVLDRRGQPLWNQRLRFADPHVRQVLPSDVAVVNGSVVVVGTTLNKGQESNAFIAAYGVHSGRRLWARRIDGRTEPNGDMFTSVSASNGRLYVSGMLDGGGIQEPIGPGVVERWKPSGERLWQRHISAASQLSALRGGSVTYFHRVAAAKHETFVMGNIGRSGVKAWKFRWSLPPRQFTSWTSFDATASRGLVGADLTRRTRPKYVTRLWSWTWST